MPPALLFDHSQITRGGVLVGREEIYETLPQRHEFALLDGVLHLDGERGEAVAYCDITEEAYWVRGHIPGRPLMPGVLQVEAAAQLVSYATLRLYMKEDPDFLGLGGLDKFKFRGAVAPGSRLLLLGKMLEARSRKLVWACQGLISDRLIFQGEITGMPV